MPPPRPPPSGDRATSSAGHPPDRDRGRPGDPLRHGPEGLAAVPPPRPRRARPPTIAATAARSRRPPGSCSASPATSSGNIPPGGRADPARAPRARPRRHRSPRSGASRSPSPAPASIAPAAAARPSPSSPGRPSPTRSGRSTPSRMCPWPHPSRVSWLTVTDEASGAILAAELSPPPPLGARAGARDPGDVPSRLRPLGPARPRAGRQRVSLGHPPRLAQRAGDVADRAGGRTDLDPPAQPTCNPKVERSNGVAQQWGELQTCTDCEQAARALDWVCRVQREEYPAIRGRTRARRSRSWARRAARTGGPARRRCGTSPGWTASWPGGAGGGMPTATG